ncbi:Hypothetical predicted protein [Paramuricea clavata]|uniref:Uncharacterized protein n=1 Tax=Paramuricea clavata TaxID=317549 RepID=A0A6S7GF38_PARCT|nr:Hypothetical predicted protein [Paramuricea clavata]
MVKENPVNSIINDGKSLKEVYTIPKSILCSEYNVPADIEMQMFGDDQRSGSLATEKLGEAAKVVISTHSKHEEDSSNSDKESDTSLRLDEKTSKAGTSTEMYLDLEKLDEAAAMLAFLTSSGILSKDHVFYQQIYSFCINAMGFVDEQLLPKMPHPAKTWAS